MSQVVNGVTSSSKRPYRKGNPLSDADKQRSSVAKKRATHKEVKVFLEPQLKDILIMPRKVQDLLCSLLPCNISAGSGD